MYVSRQEPIVVLVPCVTVTHRNHSYRGVFFTRHHFRVTVLLDHLLDPIKCVDKDAHTHLSFNVVTAVYQHHPFPLRIYVLFYAFKNVILHKKNKERLRSCPRTKVSRET